MHIEPIIPDLDFVTIRKTGGIAGIDQTLHIDRRLVATVTDRHSGDRLFEVDAYESQELMHALVALVERNPAPSSRRGFDLFHYDVELSIGGRLHTFHSVDLGADEALHGVMLAAQRLATQPDHPFHPMDLHLQPATTTA